MKKLFFTAIALVAFSAVSFAGNVEVKKEEPNKEVVVDKLIAKVNSNKNFGTKTCVTVGVSIGIFSVEVEVCCWRTKNTGSPVYDCSIGNGGPIDSQNNSIQRVYLNVETLDLKILKEIKDKKLISLNLSKSSIEELDDFHFSIKKAKYDIYNDENGRYLIVDLYIVKR